MKSRLPLMIVALLLLAMAVLMVGPAREETATVDETTFMGGGYGYFKTGSTKMAEENPLLAQMIIAAPLLLCDVHLSEQAIAIMEQRAFSPVAYPWKGPPARLDELFPHGVNWYHIGMAESQFFGQALVYNPNNNSARLLFCSRITALLMTVLTGMLLFFWARRLSDNAWAGVLAAALWLLNPVTLGFGHLAITEPGICLTYAATLWWSSRTFAAPTSRNCLVLGALSGLAMNMKFVAFLLGPTFVVLLGLHWWWSRQASGQQFPSFGVMTKRVAITAAGFWVVALIVFFPHWSPPPPIDPLQAQLLRVPDWFLSLRPLLMPGEFFRALALKFLKSQSTQSGVYLMGQWGNGWWYYYPVAVFFKTPIPWLLLAASGAVGLLCRWRKESFAALVPWIGAVVYLGLATTSKLNIGMRHVMPVYPLLAVGIADQLARMGRRWHVVALVLCGWLVVVVSLAYPLFLPYCNEFAGGTANGYKMVLDSNYDWGQDGKRLKQWMDDNAVKQIYLDYFGTQASIEWLQIPNTRVNAEQARQIKQGWLVVSVSELMRPEWSWLRDSRQPDARIAYTLFAYRLS